MKSSPFAIALSLLAATPAYARDETAPPAPITVTGQVAVVSDYRFRGVSRSDGEIAAQGGLTVAHESGVHAGAWASSLSGRRAFVGADAELDLIAGIRAPLGGGAIDVGLTWYLYPGGACRTDVVEPYARLSGTIGPLSLIAGVAYAPKQRALGNRSEAHADGGDNLYLWGDAAAAIPGTPVTAKAHIGYSDGSPGLGAGVTTTGAQVDWLLGADAAIRNTPLTLGVAYVDTDAGKRDGKIAGPRLVFSASAAF